MGDFFKDKLTEGEFFIIAYFRQRKEENLVTITDKGLVDILFQYMPIIQFHQKTRHWTTSIIYTFLRQE